MQLYKSHHRKILVIAFAVIGALSLSALSPAPEPGSPGNSGAGKQELSPFRIALAPGVILPLGPSASYISPAAIITADFVYLPGFLTGMTLGAEAGYAAAEYNSADLLSSTFLHFKAGYELALSARLTIAAQAGGGYALSFVTIGGQPQMPGGGSLTAGLGARLSLMPALDLFLTAEYRMLQGLYSGASLSIGSSLRFARASRPGALLMNQNHLSVDTIDLDKVFPVFYSYYDDHAIGTITVHNSEKRELEDIRVSFLVNEYMEAPKTCARLETLNPESQREILIYALFTDELLEITEGKKVTAKLIVEYKRDGQDYRDEHTASLEIAYRNAMTWDDDRRAAAFVTARDPHVRAFAGNTGRIIKESEYTINPNLSKAIVYFEAIRLHGITYQRDPSTPYDEMSADTLLIDSLQFPRETLDYRAGDCDDLSILFSALLESVFVPTAFITIPGHIFLAVSLEIPPDQARREFARPENLIFMDDQTWLPLEITALDKSFMEAWELGAREWRQGKEHQQAQLYPIREAWSRFKPVGLPAPSSSVALPDMESLKGQYSRQVLRFVDSQIYPQVQAITERIEEQGGKASPAAQRWVNRLGVLYCRYGLYDRALEIYKEILNNRNALPALLNVGTIHFNRDEFRDARRYYEQAAMEAPDHPMTILSLARVNHELENYGEVRYLYDRLKSVDSALAEEYAYLEMRGQEAARAAAAQGGQGQTLWFEEEWEE